MEFVPTEVVICFYVLSIAYGYAARMESSPAAAAGVAARLKQIKYLDLNGLSAHKNVYLFIAIKGIVSQYKIQCAIEMNAKTVVQRK